jgi:hypothetical protein
MGQIFTLLTILILANSFIYGQRIGFDIIDDSKVSPWMAKTSAEYQQVYSFGASEMESSLILLFSDGEWFAQIRHFIMDEKTHYEWVPDFINLRNVRIEGNKFYSNLTNGEFVIYDYGKRKEKGLKVYKPWSGWESGIYEIGISSAEPVSKCYSGRFPQASYKKLEPEDLKGKSKPDLKIMRNEIFARYGYKFTPESEMDNYFKQQSWYRAYYDNVNSFLTRLEIENIGIIKQFEEK